MTVFFTDGNGIKLPNNYNLLLLKFTLRGYFSQNFVSVKPKSWRRKSHALRKPRFAGKTKIKFSGIDRKLDSYVTNLTFLGMWSGRRILRN